MYFRSVYRVKKFVHFLGSCYVNALKTFLEIKNRSLLLPGEKHNYSLDWQSYPLPSWTTFFCHAIVANFGVGLCMLHGFIPGSKRFLCLGCNSCRFYFCCWHDVLPCMAHNCWCLCCTSIYWHLISKLNREVMSTSLTHPSAIRRHQLRAANDTFHGISSLN